MLPFFSRCYKSLPTVLVLMFPLQCTAILLEGFLWLQGHGWTILGESQKFWAVSVPRSSLEPLMEGNGWIHITVSLPHWWANPWACSTCSPQRFPAELSPGCSQQKPAYSCCCTASFLSPPPVHPRITSPVNPNPFPSLCFGESPTQDLWVGWGHWTMGGSAVCLFS